MRQGRTRSAASVLAAALALVISVLPAAASGDPVRTTEPTLTLVRQCDVFPAGISSANVLLTGFPPLTSFELTLVFGENGLGPVQLTTDESGSFDLADIGALGIGPAEWTATVVWSGGTLTESLFVDCSQPASKEDCKNGGWREFGFKSQGECIAFVVREH
jgi:hypothetical protein